MAYIDYYYINQRPSGPNLALKSHFSTAFFILKNKILVHFFIQKAIEREIFLFLATFSGLISLGRNRPIFLL